MSDKPDYAPILADLERQRAEIDQAIATLRRLAELPEGVDTNPNGIAGAEPAGISGEIPNHAFLGMRAPDAIKTYLAATKRPQTAAKISSELVAHGLPTTSDSPADIIRTALRRLRDSGEVVQVKKEWGLAEWFPSFRPPKAKPSARKRRAKRASSGSQAAHAPPKAKRNSPYLRFVSEQRKAGKSLEEAAAAWRAQKETKK